jgi:diguanylate cyclase (GGDEF)-like protein/PAS domain S-box-containing protein
MIRSDPSLEYVTCDANFAITGYSGGAFRVLAAPPPVQDIRDCIPELVGLEETIAEIWQQARPSFELKGIQRAEGRFIDLMLVCETLGTTTAETAGNLLVLIRDVSERMTIEQRLSQVAKEYNLAVQELSTTQQYLSQVIECMGDALLITDPQGQIKQINPAAERLFAYDRAALIGQPITALLPKPTERPAREWLQLWQSHQSEQACCTRTGQPLTIAFSCTALVNQLTEEREFVCIGRDVTLRKHMEQQLHNQLTAYQLLNQLTQHLRHSLSLDEAFQRTAEMLQQWLLCDRVLIAQWLDPKRGGQLHTALSLAEEAPFTLQPLTHPITNPLAALQQQMTPPAVSHELTLPLYQKRIFWGAIAVQYCTESPDWDNQVVHVLEQVSSHLSMAIAQLQLYAQLEKTNRELNALAYRDPLTLFVNGRFFQYELEKAWHKSIVTGSPLSLLICELDFFPEYQAHYGVVSGDECLRILAQLLTYLTQNLPSVVARHDREEEFVLLLEETPPQQLTALVQQLQSAIAQQALPHAQSPIAEVVTLSLGGVTFDPAYRSWQPADLLHYATQALAQTRAQGHNGSHFWTT